MARKRITAVVLNDRDMELIGSSLVERIGDLAICDVRERKLRALTNAGLLVQSVAPDPSTRRARRQFDQLRLAPPPFQPEPEGWSRFRATLRRFQQWLQRPLQRMVEPADGAEAAVAAAAPSAASDVYVLAFDGPLPEERLSELEARGCELIERVGPATATVRVQGGPEAFRDLPWIVQERRYGVEETLNPELAERDPEGGDVTQEAYVDGKYPVDEIVEWLRALGVDVVGSSAHKVRFRVPRGDPRQKALAALSQVMKVDEYIRPTLSNDHGRRLIGVDLPDGGPPVPWTGRGQIVAMADSGIDDQHPDFAGRIRATFSHGRGHDTSDPVGHGTHVAGSICGAGPQIRGVAPECELVVQSLLQPDGDFDIPVELKDVFDQAKNAGAHIHNNSWGALARSGYRRTSLELDTWAFDNPGVLIVVAAGNDATAATNTRSGPGHVDLFSTNAPGTAKNALTVGASRSDRTIDPPLTWREFGQRNNVAQRFADDPIGSEAVAGSAEGMAAFSGRGPCDNEIHLKPDVVAPGTYILSTRSSAAPDSAYWKTHDGQYAYLGGTSMAAPFVAGMTALIRQYYVEDRDHVPSAALLKATIVCGARWLTGADSIADHPEAPNYHQGFGIVDLLGSLPVPNSPGSPQRLVFTDDWQGPELQLNGFGKTRDFFVTVTGPRLRMCLAWTDPPRRGVQYPLSLTVEAGERRWGGNDRRPNNPLGTLDGGNNVQVVRIVDAPPGDYLIRVIDANDVLIDRRPQSFALVVTGDIGGDLIPQ